ncbi:hypothetical protein F5Y05DRAFT_101667 [Hypoxylon sp. FL0543]|nr:hypothetical protein F5Y05DRAFT_101667 [Hypoxylon sp. FL0543]
MSSAASKVGSDPADTDSDWETWSTHCTGSFGSGRDSPTAEQISEDRSSFMQTWPDFEWDMFSPTYSSGTPTPQNFPENHPIPHSTWFSRTPFEDHPSVPHGYSAGSQVPEKHQGLHRYVLLMEKCRNANLSIASTSEDQQPIRKNPLKMNVSSVGASSGASSSPDGVATQHDDGFPSGSAANHSKAAEDTQVMTDSMLRAYVTMRGPQGSTADVYGPLAQYGKLREEPAGASSRPQGAKPDASGNKLETLDDNLPTDYLGYYAPNVAFEIPKPHIGNVEYPNGFQWGDDSDDEEGANPSGAISPSMFLELATGAKRWDHDEIKDPKGVLNDATRTRPEGPTGLSDNDHYPEYLDKAIAQVDQETGEEISPTYIVPPSPSIIWTPPGVTEKPFVKKHFHASYRRMAPDDAEAHSNRHRRLNGEPEAPPAHTHEHYSKTEVQAIANKVHGEQLGPQLPVFFDLQYNSIAQYKAHCANLAKEIKAQEEQIAALEKEREQLHFWYIPALLHLRAKRQAEKEKVREERIKEHIANHVHDAQKRLEQAAAAVGELQHKYTGNLAYIAGLEQEMSDACMDVGANSPQEVYDEVNGPEVNGPEVNGPEVNGPETSSSGSSIDNPEDYDWSPSTGLARCTPGTAKQSSGGVNYGYEAGLNTQQPGSHLYGNKKDAYGTSQPSSPFCSDEVGNVGPSVRSTTSKWSVVTGQTQDAGPSSQQRAQVHTPPRPLRRSYRDVSEASRGSDGEAQNKGKGKGKRVAGDTTTDGVESSSWDTDIF